MADTIQENVSQPTRLYGRSPGGVLTAVAVDASGNLQTNTSTPNASVGPTGTTAPTSATEIGVIDNSGKLRGASSTNPIRVDPVGTTVQPVSGTILATPPSSSTSSVPAATSVGTASVSILAANLTRVECMVQNTGTTIIYLGLGQTPTVTAYHIALLPCGAANSGTGGIFISDVWKGAINAIGSAASGTVVVTEMT